MSNAEQATASELPKDTTPTWEMELLVSGATIVGLLQLPELLARAHFRTLNLRSSRVAVAPGVRKLIEQRVSR